MGLGETLVTGDLLRQQVWVTSGRADVETPNWLEGQSPTTLTANSQPHVDIDERRTLAQAKAGPV